MEEESSEEEWISPNTESGQMALPGSNHVRRRGAKRDEKRGDSRENHSPSSSDNSPVRRSRKGPAKTSTMNEQESQVPAAVERGLLDHRLWRIVSGVFGVTMMIILASLHVVLLATLHENHLWFSNIKEVEREISFRTEAGLYYSYYKQLVNAPSFSQGLEDLTRDNITEHGRTINILERFNIYQEVILAAAYRGFDVKTRPIFFYLYSTFGLQGLLIAAIYAISWSLSGSWVAACLTAVSYTLNRADTTRVNYTAPLRESYSLPFLWCQIFFISCLLRLPERSAGWKKMFYLTLMGLSQFFFILFWQFAQFIFLLQSLALFSAALVGLVPAQRILEIYRVKFCMFLLVCALQFGNKMILTSLVIAFIPAALLVLAIKRWKNRGDEEEGSGLVKNVFLTIFYILLAFILTSLLNRLVRHLVHHRSDTHVFQFLQHKLGFGDKRNFDAMLYVCTGAFDWLPFDTYERLQTTWLLPLYIVGHVYLIYTLARTLLLKWGAWPVPMKNGKERKSDKKRRDSDSEPGTMEPDLAFHTVTSILFALMGIGALRFKYLWTVYMCVYAGYAVTHRRIYTRILSFLNLDTWALETIRHGVGAMVVTAIVLNNLTQVKKELNDLREFYDPDTVQLMEWINTNTAPTAAFSGSMQLLAGVKLCTGRPLTNHPHYEDFELRDRTQKLYGFYGRTPPEQMYSTLVHYNTSYIILEDSICLAKSQGCRTPDIVDMTRGQIPDSGDDYGGLLQASTVPRFCHEIRYGKPEFSKYFTLVFSNRTFRVYQVKEPEVKPKTTKTKKVKITVDTVQSR